MIEGVVKACGLAHGLAAAHNARIVRVSHTPRMTCVGCARAWDVHKRCVPLPTCTLTHPPLAALLASALPSSPTRLPRTHQAHTPRTPPNRRRQRPGSCVGPVRRAWPQQQHVFHKCAAGGVQDHRRAHLEQGACTQQPGRHLQVTTRRARDGGCRPWAPIHRLATQHTHPHITHP
jgi:hypothetical protein